MSHGDALYCLQCWDEALDCYPEVSRLQHDNLTARLAAAYCLDRLGKFMIYIIMYYIMYVTLKLEKEFAGRKSAWPSPWPAGLLPAAKWRSSGGGVPGRVAPGDCSPGAPTDPGLHMTRTRFLIS